MNKHLHLILTALLLSAAGLLHAQDFDVYTCGTFTNSYGKSSAAVYKNGNQLYSYGNADYNYTTTAVAVDPDTRDVYWTISYHNNDYTFRWCKIYKNGDLYLTNTTQNEIYELCFYEGHLYALGSRMINQQTGRTEVCVWKDSNTNPFFSIDNNHSEFADPNYEVDPPIPHFCIAGKLADDGAIYVAYYAHEQVEENTYIYVTNVYKYTFTLFNYELIYTIPFSNVKDIAYYDGNVYTAYRTNNGTTCIYKNSSLWSEKSFEYISNICVESGDVYALYPSFDRKIYKNDVEYINLTRPANLFDVNSFGVFFNSLISSYGIYKGNTQLFTLPNEAVDMTILCSCEDDYTRSLPFTESFEAGDTEWECWTKLDVDNHNNGYASYWDRSGTGSSVAPYSGNYCAKHRYLSSAAQTGWLISPRLFLQPGRDLTQLTFKTYEQYPNAYGFEGVFVSTTGTSPSDFTQVWTQNNPSASWKNVTIDLSAYQGEAVYIAFKYSGQNAHNWYIDDIEVTESQSQCYTEGYLPYTQTFDYEMGICWYVIDADMSGGKKCWKWSSSNQCVMHPYGQSGVPQEGWLISRPISIWQEDYGYTLSFKSKSTSNGTGRRNSVWISVDQPVSNPPNPVNFTEIWVDPSYSDGWTEYEIDLSEYAGHNINIAFKYEGTYAHNWYIDDVSVTQFVPAVPVTITATANPIEGGTVSGGGTYAPGATCTLTATANPGYAFWCWVKGVDVVSTNPTYTFTVTESVSYDAWFWELGSALTVYPDATETDNHIPMYVYYFDEYSRAQHIMPASELTALAGSQITAIQYYTNADNIPYTTLSEIDFYLKEVDSPTLSAYVDKSTAQIVYHGTVDFTAANGGGVTTITFTTPFTYNGGNLLIGCENTTNAGYKNIMFYGESEHSGTGLYGSSNAGPEYAQSTPSSFLPKTTFIYTEGSGGSITQTTNFTNGWNWWSSYVELDNNSLTQLQDGLGTNGVTIKSQNNGYNSYLEGFGWYGSLTAINNESSYQVRTTAPCTVEFNGNEANPSSHTITITPGWSWIGYPVNASLSVTDALAGVTAHANDMLKSQNSGYASYLEGFGWYGQLSTLTPGMGLMYKSNGSGNATFTYPNSAKGNPSPNPTTENNYWQPNLNAYPDNMSLMAVVELDGEELALRQAQGPDNYELAAFANGECRGSAKLTYVEPLNRYIAFLTVAGDEAVELNFSLHNAETGVVETCGASLQYETNAVVGSFDEPYVVRFRSTTSVDEWANSLQVYPNPVEKGQTISLGFNDMETSKVQVEIINALGVVVETRRATSLQTITAPEAAGVYTLRITVEGKGTCYRKLVVE